MNKSARLVGSIPGDCFQIPETSQNCHNIYTGILPPVRIYCRKDVLKEVAVDVGQSGPIQ